MRGYDKLFGRNFKVDTVKELWILTFADLHLMTEIRKIDEVGQDVSCDFKLILSIINEVGEAIYTKFQWVTDDDLTIW